MHKIILLLLIAFALQAGVMDFKALSEAKQAYKQKDYATAAELYGKIQHKNDAARYNYGDALYRQKKYKEATGVFNSIKAPDLKAKALHNLGNSYVKLGKTDEAIKAYEEALKHFDDTDTRYNLELLKQQKKQQQKRQNKKNQQKNKNQNQKNKKNNQQDKKNSAQKQQKNKSGDQTNPQKNKQDKQKQQRPKSKSEKQKSKNEKHQQKQTGAQDKKKEEERRKTHSAMPEQQPISDMEERKYNKMLDKRGIKTLMIPLQSKGESRENETTPW